MIKTLMTSYLADGYCSGLAKTLNEIGWNNVLQVLPIYNEKHGTIYTIIYKESELK